MTDIIGKTVQSVEAETWAGYTAYKDDVTWTRTVITFTDGETLTFDQSDSDVYDPYRCVLDDDGHPHPYVKETTACKHCGHGIGYIEDVGWVAPDAGFDVENGDGIWRATCPDNDDFPNPEHEPVEDDPHDNDGNRITPA